VQLPVSATPSAVAQQAAPVLTYVPAEAPGWPPPPRTAAHRRRCHRLRTHRGSAAADERTQPPSVFACSSRTRLPAAQQIWCEQKGLAQVAGPGCRVGCKHTLIGFCRGDRHPPTLAERPGCALAEVTWRLTRCANNFPSGLYELILSRLERRGVFTGLLAHASGEGSHGRRAVACTGCKQHRQRKQPRSDQGCDKRGEAHAPADSSSSTAVAPAAKAASSSWSWSA